MEWRYNETLYLFFVWKDTATVGCSKHLFTALYTDWSLCVSDSVQSENLTVTGNSCKTWKRSTLHKQTNTLTDTVISLMHSKLQFNLLLDRRHNSDSCSHVIPKRNFCNRGWNDLWWSLLVCYRTGIEGTEWYLTLGKKINVNFVSSRWYLHLKYSH